MKKDSTFQMHHHRARVNPRNEDPSAIEILEKEGKGSWQVNSIQKILSFHPGLVNINQTKKKNALKNKTKRCEPMEQKSTIYTNNFWTNITFLFIKP